jgi:hypothetical protein
MRPPDLVRALVGRHGGRLGIESVERMGTTVTVEFPCAPQSQPRPETLNSCSARHDNPLTGQQRAAPLHRPIRKNKHRKTS